MQTTGGFEVVDNEIIVLLTDEVAVRLFPVLKGSV